MSTIRISGKRPDGLIPASELWPGQVAEVVRWDKDTSCVGLLVKRCVSRRIETLAGTPYWSEGGLEGSLLVRVLPNGTLLRVEDNE